MNRPQTEQHSAVEHKESTPCTLKMFQLAGLAPLPHFPVQIRMGCKINLYLRILGRQEDGYHELDTFFMPLPEPHDLLTIREGRRVGLEVLCDCTDINPHNNILGKAYTLYLAETGFAPKLQLTLKKGIPRGAGLGGGSADAAALLVFLQAYNPSPCSTKKILEIAKKTGADVPFFLYNIPCQATGIGETLEPAPLPAGLKSGMFLLLLSPEIQVPTPWAFAKWDEEKNNLFQKTHLTNSGEQVYKPVSCLRLLENDFEQLVFEKWPSLRECKALLLRAGASAALLSGSGSSIFALFRTRENAEKAMYLVQDKGSVFLCRVFNGV